MSTDDDLSRRRLLEASAATGLLLVAASASAAPAAGTTTVARYALERLRQHGVEHLFGVPGATCDPLFAAADAGMAEIVVGSSDLESAYAADGYARTRGLAALAVTYGVGTMGTLSVIGGAYVERSPIVILNGGPSAEDLRIQRELGSLFSHSTGRDASDRTMFAEVTAYAERAERASDVPKVVDAAIRAALETRRPVYVEIPKHLWDASCPTPGAPIAVSAAAGEEAALAPEIALRLKAASRPLLLVGVEVQRFGQQDAVTALIGRLGIPWASTFLGKSTIAEQTPGFVGVYGGTRAVPAPKKAVDEADLVLAVGCVLGRQYRELVTGDLERLIRVSADGVRIGSAPARKATLGPMVAALAAQPWTTRSAPSLRDLSFDGRRGAIPASASTEEGLGFDEVVRAISGFVDETHVVVTDTSLSMYPAAEIDVTGRSGFVCNGVWQAIGWSVGASVGIAIGGKRRPVVLCGDGGFQMTAQALSTLARRRLPAIVVVLDNGHYGIEQWLLEPAYFGKASNLPREYLGLQRWRYADLAKALGIGTAVTVDTVGALEGALRSASGPTLICATVRPHDLPAGLRA